MKYNLTSQQLQSLINLAKEMLIDKLAEAGELKSDLTNLKLKYAFILLEKGTLGSYLDKLYFSKNSMPRMQLIESQIVIEDKPNQGLRLVTDEEKE